MESGSLKIALCYGKLTLNNLPHFAVYVLLLFSLAACAAPPTPAPTERPFDREAETYRIYAAFVGPCGERPMYISPETSPVGGDAYDFINEDLDRENLAPLQRSTMDDFLQNTTSILLDTRYDYGHPVEFITGEKYFAWVEEAGGSRAYATANPDDCGFTTLSQVAFSREKDQALVYVFWSGEDWCHGYFHILHREDSQWDYAGAVRNEIC
jgi:hypothetical protein